MQRPLAATSGHGSSGAGWWACLSTPAGARMQFKDYYEILGVPARRIGRRDQEGFPAARAQVPPDVSKAPDRRGAHERRSTRPTGALRRRTPRRLRPAARARARAARSSSRRRVGTRAQSPPGAASRTARAPTSATSSPSSSAHGGAAGARGAGFGGHARGRPARGQDHHAKILLGIEDTRSLGARRQLSLRAPRWTRRVASC